MVNCNLVYRHIIGKDIIWFHCVIWPCILMSAGVTLPVGVFSHGFVNAADGRKMSKSYNNAIDPHEVRKEIYNFSLFSIRNLSLHTDKKRTAYKYLLHD